MKKYKIAISLVCHNDEYLLNYCINSLLKSDIINHNLKLFCYDNNSNENLKRFLNQIEMDKWIYSSESNEGIVIPRIKIYQEIIKENFDFILELHSDMLFPKKWLEPLIEIFDETTGIIQPHIFVPRSKGQISLEYFESKLPDLLSNNQYEKCRQNHPWLINTKIIDKIGGYYDEIFSPHECEDDDFVYRVLKNGFKIKSTGLSWVVHYGGSIRHKLLPSNLSRNKKLFSEKNNISFEDFVEMFEIHPHYVD